MYRDILARHPFLRFMDLDTPGRRYDLTPLFQERGALDALSDALHAPFESKSIDLIAGLDALGFILGATLAARCGAGFLPVRKGGKLPVPTNQREFVDYTATRKGLELRADLDLGGARVLVIDDWVETGAQMRAATALLEAQGANIQGVAAICIEQNEETSSLLSLYHCHDLWHP